MCMTVTDPSDRKSDDGGALPLKLITEGINLFRMQQTVLGSDMVVGDSCHGHKNRFARHMYCGQRKKESIIVGATSYEKTSENFAQFEGFTSADLFTAEQRKFLADCTTMQRTKFWHWLRKGRITATRIVPLVSVIQKIYSYDTEDGKKINQALN